MPLYRLPFHRFFRARVSLHPVQSVFHVLLTRPHLACDVVYVTITSTYTAIISSPTSSATCADASCISASLCSDLGGAFCTSTQSSSASSTGTANTTSSISITSSASQTSSTSTSAGPSIVPTAGPFTYSGCYDGPLGSVLGNNATTVSSIADCATQCAGDPYFGVDDGGNCKRHLVPGCMKLHYANSSG